MAKVPSATDLGLGQVKQTGAGSTPFQSLNTNADMFGAAQARNFQEMGAGLDRLAEAKLQAEIKEQREADERHAMEIEQQIREWKFERLQGENGVYNRRGGGAIGATKSVEKDFGKFAGTLTQGRTISNQARMRLDSYIKQQGISIQSEVSNYERQEKRHYDNGLRQARIDGSIEDAALNYNDPQKIAEAESKIRSTHRANAGANGWSPEETQQQIERDVSSMHKAVIDRMLANKEGSAAQEYLKKNIKEIDGRDIAAVEKAVAGGVIAQKAQTAVDEIMSRNLSATEALKVAREKYSGEEEDEIVQRLKVRYSEESSLESAQSKALRQSAWDKISRGGTPDDLTPTELTAMGREVESAWTMVKNRAQRGKGFALTSDKGVAEEYLGMTDAEIVDVDLNAVIPRVTEGDYNKILNRQKDAERNLEDLKKNPGQSATINRLLKEFAPKSWNVGSTKASSTRRAQANEARDQLNGFVRQSLEKKKQLPSEDELRAEAARIMLQITYDSPWPFDEQQKTVSELSDENLENIDIEDDELSNATGVPIEAINIIKKQWPKNKPITINGIISAYEANRGKF